MRIRARQAGGTLTVESTPGEGTVVSVAVPFTVEEPAL
jgi:signal transduction histidine kinase